MVTLEMGTHRHVFPWLLPEEVVVPKTEYRGLTEADLYNRSLRKTLESNILGHTARVFGYTTPAIEQAELQEVEDYLQRMQESLVEPQRYHYEIAVQGDDVVGTIGMRVHSAAELQQVPVVSGEIPIEDGVVEVMNFYVQPGYQRQGIGGNLWNRLHSHIDQLNPPNAFLSCKTTRCDLWDVYRSKGYSDLRLGEYRGVYQSMYFLRQE